MDNKAGRKRNFVKRERYYGSFSRSFDISGINAEGIEATYNDGVLTLTMRRSRKSCLQAADWRSSKLIYVN